MPTSRALILLLVSLLGGCLTARVAAGPTVSTGGHSGMTATGGIGLGYSLRDGKALYATPNFGVVATDHARALAFDTLTYVDYGLPFPVRVDARLGFLLERKKYGEAGRSMFGAAVAVLPWHGKSPREHYHSEKGWGDLGPDLSVFRGLGIEVAVDALPAPSPQDRTLVMATISLVGDVGIQMDR